MTSNAVSPLDVAVLMETAFFLGVVVGALIELRRSRKVQNEIFRAWEESERRAFEVLGIYQTKEREA